MIMYFQTPSITQKWSSDLLEFVLYVAWPILELFWW